MGFLDGVKNAVNPSTIEDFKATINKRRGLANQNRFAVIMQPPSASLLDFDLQSIGASLLSGTFSLGGLVNDPRDIALLCESCSLPGRNIESRDYQNVRQNLKKPTGIVIEPITFSFHLTNDMYMKKMFDKWTDIVFNRDSYTANYKSTYCTDVIIQQLNKENIPVYGVKLKNAWPENVAAVDLNNTSENTTQRITVTMNYDDFEVEGALSSALSGVKTAIGGIKSLF
tara:strand:+ start:613 stop:1296 length:684 start_codon:yes stop_codon:yes gene_type:complete